MIRAVLVFVSLLVLAGCDVSSSSLTLAVDTPKTITFTVEPDDSFNLCVNDGGVCTLRDQVAGGFYAMQLWTVNENYEKDELLVALPDDGTGADDTASDGVFTGEYTFDESRIGFVRLRLLRQILPV